ncbi:MAG: hypothetical protein RLZZ227_3136, partial [Pseudomonadota bacterium]
MRRLDRYIGKNVLLAMAVVLLALGGLDLLFTVFEELGDTEGSYSTTAALRYVALTAPRHIYELLPMTALVGALVGLGILAGSNELVAIQAAGVSRARIVLAVLKPTLLVIALGLVLGEWIAPPLELRAEVGKALARGEQVALSRYGHWERDGNTFMHFNAIEPDGVLYGVSIFTFDEQQRMTRTVNAERAVYVEGESRTTNARRGAVVVEDRLSTAAVGALQDSPWILRDGTEIEFSHVDGKVEGKRSDFDLQGWDLDLTP